MSALMGEWNFTPDEMDIMGLSVGDVLGPGVVGFPREEVDDDE